jgi:hypothetical protein
MMTGAPVTFDVRGVVIDEAGGPVIGARVGIWTEYVMSPSTVTDGGGEYRLTFTGIAGQNHFPGFDPPGLEGSVAFLAAEAQGFEAYARHLLGTTEQLRETVRLQAVRHIRAGDSTAVTAWPDARLCVLDGWPGREYQCAAVHVVAPRDGALTVAAAEEPFGDAPTLSVSGFDANARGNPVSIHVSAQRAYTVTLILPWSNRKRTFTVETSLSTAF